MMTSFARAGLLLVAMLFAAPLFADSAHFHLSENGFCNETDKEIIFGASLSCNGKCDKCELKDSTGFDSKGGGRLAPGACATASYYLETDGDTCGASMTYSADGGSCEFDAWVFTMGEGKELSLRYCSPPLIGTNGDEHFQIHIKSTN